MKYHLAGLFAKWTSCIPTRKIKTNMANLIDESSFMKAYSNLNKNLRVTETNLWQMLLLLKVITNIILIIMTFHNKLFPKVQMD